MRTGLASVLVLCLAACMVGVGCSSRRETSSGVRTERQESSGEGSSPASTAAPAVQPLVSVERLRAFLPEQIEGFTRDMSRDGESDRAAGRNATVMRLFTSEESLGSTISITIVYEKNDRRTQEERIQRAGSSSHTRGEYSGHPSLERDGVVYQFIVFAGDCMAMLTGLGDEKAAVRAAAGQMDIAGLAGL